MVLTSRFHFDKHNPIGKLRQNINLNISNTDLTVNNCIALTGQQFDSLTLASIAYILCTHSLRSSLCSQQTVADSAVKTLAHIAILAMKMNHRLRNQRVRTCNSCVNKMTDKPIILAR